MAVLIKGMEMPESGTYEVSIDSANGKDKTVMSLFVRGEGGLICCGVYELIPVPPHGRLIDADALADSFDPSDFWNPDAEDNCFAAVRIVHSASTIIPASEEG